MSRILKLEVIESTETLKEKIRTEKNTRKQQRLDIGVKMNQEWG